MASLGSGTLFDSTVAEQHSVGGFLPNTYTYTVPAGKIFQGKVFWSKTGTTGNLTFGGAPIPVSAAQNNGTDFILGPGTTITIDVSTPGDLASLYLLGIYLRNP